MSSYDNFNNSHNSLIKLISGILEKGELNQEDKDNLDREKINYNNSYIEVKNDLQDAQTKELEKKIIEISSKSSDLSQLDVFNALTNNGKAQGFFIDEETDEVYLNAEFLQTRGLRVVNDNGEQTLYIDDTGNLTTTGDIVGGTITGTKLQALTIDTNEVNIESNDGGMVLRGALQQFKDKNNRVRIQIGKNEQGNFNFTLFGKNGESVLIDENGIKADAISTGLISTEHLSTNVFEAVDAKIETAVIGKADIEDLNAANANITNLKTENATIKNLVAEKANIKDLEATNADITNLKSENANIKNLVAEKADIEDLNTTNANIENLQANHAQLTEVVAGKATITDLNAVKADIGTLNAGKANITELNAVKAEVGVLKADVADIDELLAGNITAENIQTGAITAGSGIIANGAIGSAQISSIDAGKISAGKIDTSKVEVSGTNNHLKIKGNRMQVFQGTGSQAKERVSLGDVNGDGTLYGLRVRGADGTTVLIDENGVKSEGITDGSITNEKINENANIDGDKININSVVDKINEDGTKSIVGTKINVGDGNLTAKLSNITEKQTEDSERITQAQSDIVANTNAIKLKVDEQTYTTDKKDMTNKLEKNTSEISAMKGEIALKVEQTDIENAINGIEIGGRNYALQSHQEKFINKNYYVTYALSQDKDNMNNKKVIVSFDAKKEEGSPSVDMHAYFRGTSALNPNSNKIGDVTEEYKRYSVEIQPSLSPTDATHIGINTGTASGKVYVKNVKVEIEKKSDWSIAPEDVDTKINSAKAEIKVTTDAIAQNVSNLSQTVSTKADGSTVTEINNKVGSLETSVNGISGKVTNLEKTTTTLGENVEGVKGEVSTLKSDVASLEVTTSGISQKVSSVESTTKTLTTQVGTAQDTANQAKTDASNAKTLADSKAKVFTATPTTPYKIGDLWVQGTTGDVMRCKTARTTGSYTASDWEKASKYTDDAKANAVDGKVNTLQGEYNSTKSKVATLETNLDGITQRVSSTESTTATLTTKVSDAQATANTANSTANTNKGNITNLQGEVSTVKNNIAELNVTTEGISQKVSSVESTTATLTGKVNTAQSAADSKAKVFTSTPTTPYKVGDLWVQGTTGDVMRCKTARSSGSYNSSDWERASKYTDDTKANAVDGKVTNLQTEYNKTKSQVAEIVTDLNGITQRVSSTESTTATLTTKVSDAQSTANTANSNATNALNTANSTNTKLNNLQIGGRNLIRKADVAQNNSTATFNESTKTWTIKASAGAGGTWGCGLVLRNKNVLVPYGKQYVLSFEIKVPRNCSWKTEVNTYALTGSSWAGNDNDNTSKRSTSSKSLTANQWIKCWVKWENTNANNTNKVDLYDNSHFGVVMQNETSDMTYEIRNVQGELGNMPTEYTPAPEDVQSQIDTNKTEISSTKSKVSTIETNLSGITQRVSTVEQNQTSVNGKVTSLESWKKEAEQKITDSAIISTVKTSKDSNGKNTFAQQSDITQLNDSWTAKFNDGYNQGVTTINKDGITVTSSNVKSKANMSSNGFKITKTDTGEDVFKVNSDGTLSIKGSITVTGGSIPTSNLTGTISSSQLNSTITADISNAKNNASSAVTTANTAKSTADSAKTTAGNAQDTANTAKSTADTAKSTADSAKSTANTASTNATNAVNTANAVNKFVDDNKTNWTNAYDRVKQWAYGAVSRSTTINGGLIQTNTILADKIAIGDFTNYVSDPNFENNIYSNNGSWSIVTTQKHSGTKSLKLSAGAHNNTVFGLSKRISVRNGDKIYVEWWSYRDGANQPANINLSVTNSDGTNNTYDISGSVVMSPSCENAKWIKYSYVGTINTDGYAIVCAKLRAGNTLTGNWYFDDVLVKKMATGELIVDGAITTNKIHTNGLNASVIKAGTISADRLDANVIASKVNGATTLISGDKIQTGTLSASKITTGTLDAAKVTVTNLNASNITSGTINSDRLNVSTLVSKINSGSTTISGDKITTGTITTSHIHTNGLNASVIKAGTISADRINADTLRGKTITGGTISGGTVSGATITGGRIDINNGVYKVSSSGNTKIGGDSAVNTDGYLRAICEITSNGTIYSCARTNPNIYTKISEGTFNCVRENSGFGFDQYGAYVSNGSNTLYLAGNDVSSTGILHMIANSVASIESGADASVCLCKNGASYTDTTADVLKFRTSGGVSYFDPSVSGKVRAGSATNLFHTVYATNGVKTSSDRYAKENIKYLKYDGINPLATTSDDITTKDLLDFITNSYRLATYNYKNQNETKISAVAQDVIINADGTESTVGNLIVDCEEAVDNNSMLTMNQTQLLNVVIGAFQEFIKNTNDRLSKLGV